MIDGAGPLERLRSMGKRVAGPVESLAQGVAESVPELVVNAIDLNAVLDHVDVDRLLDQVDVNRLLDQVDVDRLLDRVDVGQLLDRVDFNNVAAHIDIEALVEQTELGAVIAKSSSNVASGALDVVRSQAVGLDEFIARWVSRIRRRAYTGPPRLPRPPEEPSP